MCGVAYRSKGQGGTASGMILSSDLHPGQYTVRAVDSSTESKTRVEDLSHKLAKSTCLMVAIKDLRLELTSLLMTRNLLDPMH